MMKRKRSLFLCLSSLFVLAIVLAGCGGGGGGGTTPPAEMATISGVITGSNTSLLIPGATVTAAGGGRTFTTVSGPDGRYTLHLPAAAYTLTVAKETFNEATAAIEVAAGAALTRDFTLTTGSGGTPDLPQTFQPEYYIYTGPAEFDFRSLARGKPGHRPAPDYLPLPVARGMDESACAIWIFASMWMEELPLGAIGCRLYRGDTETGPFFLITSVPLILDEFGRELDFYYTDPGLLPGQGRYYALSIYGTSGETPLTTPIQIVPLPPCILVSPAHNAELQNPRPTFSWNQVQGADALWISACGQENSFGTSLAPTATEYTPDFDLRPDVYTWIIGAYKEEEEPYYSSYYSYSYPRRVTIVEGSP